jgi:ATP-binding cassette subfamily F protein 3
VLENVNFIIERGDRVALVGVNGAGKSTLIKMLAGAEPLTSGDYKIGHNVEPDYFAQDQYKELDPDSRVLDDLRSIGARRTETELRSILGCFLFSEDDVFKQIGVLSGGERNRYALARMLLHPSNFLLLDEPTNHLDMRAKDVLLESLQDFTGTLVFVSHDRYFIDKLATRIFEVGDGKVNVYPGNYEDYLWRKEGGPESLALQNGHAPAGPTLADVPMPERAEKKRLNPQKLKQLETRCTDLEAHIANTESEIAELESRLASFSGVDDYAQLAKDLDLRRSRLEQLMSDWESASAELEAAR